MGRFGDADFNRWIDLTDVCWTERNGTFPHGVLTANNDSLNNFPSMTDIPPCDMYFGLKGQGGVTVPTDIHGRPLPPRVKSRIETVLDAAKKRPTRNKQGPAFPKHVAKLFKDIV